jgi:peptidoglycan/xylan/chitin deacetylase (PgdA/CDA1 family)
MVSTLTAMYSGCAILAFHQTSNRFYPGINNIKPADFFSIIELIRKWGFKIGEDLSDSANTDKKIVLTFDDGYQDNYEIIKRFCAENITPIVFIPSDFIGKRNSWEYSSRFFEAQHLDKRQIKELSDMGAIIGSHGSSHNSLTGMSDDNLIEDITRSKSMLQEIANREVDLISFPFGRTNSRVNAAAHKCGYRHGFTLGNRPGDKNDEEFVISRTPVYSIDDYYSLKAKLIGSKLEMFKDRIINRLAAGTIITGKKLK